MSQRIGIEVTSVAGPGVLHQLSGVIAAHEGDIVSVEIVEARRTYFEIETPGDPAALVERLRQLAIVTQVILVDTMEKVYGKRIIIMGGGMQVGQVALEQSPKPTATISGVNISQWIPFRWWVKNPWRTPSAPRPACRA